MLSIVGNAYFKHGIGIECTECNSDIKSAMLFFKDKKIIASCILCGHKNEDEKHIMSQKTKCGSCSEHITVQDIRESNPCTCGETTNKVIAIDSYRSAEPSVK